MIVVLAYERSGIMQQMDPVDRINKLLDDCFELIYGFKDIADKRREMLEKQRDFIAWMRGRLEEISRDLEAFNQGKKN